MIYYDIKTEPENLTDEEGDNSHTKHKESYTNITSYD